jgi:hypothetical protein
MEKLCLLELLQAMNSSWLVNVCCSLCSLFAKSSEVSQKRFIFIARLRTGCLPRARARARVCVCVTKYFRVSLISWFLLVHLNRIELLKVSLGASFINWVWFEFIKIGVRWLATYWLMGNMRACMVLRKTFCVYVARKIESSNRPLPLLHEVGKFSDGTQKNTKRKC